MEEIQAGPSYEMEVLCWHRPWWGLGLIGRWQEFVCRPPERMQFAEIQEWAERFRAAGASARIVQIT